LRARLDKATDVTEEFRAWIAPRIALMETCAPARFADRGGSTAFEQTVALVRKERRQLEPLLFQAQVTPQAQAPKPTVSAAKSTTAAKSKAAGEPP
jgi:hypothetical protein